MRKCVLLCLAVLIALSAAGCSRKTLTVSLAEKDFSAVSQVKLYNCHNGQYSFPADQQSLSQICRFLNTLSGEASRSQEGFYEGSYTVTLMDSGDAVIFEILFGDTDVFYCGAEGAPGEMRFDMVGTTAREVISFFSQYDTSGFSWSVPEK